VVRQMTQGLGWGSVVILAGMAGVLSGCSTLGQADSTAAIATPSVGVASATPTNGDAMAPGTMQPGIGKAITLADASCDQIKAEIATFDGDKIPQKLADFGKAKYHPTSEESIRFARYVDVEKASKDKNCAPAKMMKKPITASKTPAVKGTMAAKAMVKPVATPAAQAKVVPPTAKAPAVVPVEDGVTVTVPDSSG
jgi:hypothetical protein